VEVEVEVEDIRGFSFLESKGPYHGFFEAVFAASQAHY
jgi:hypothetical protein